MSQSQKFKTVRVTLTVQEARYLYRISKAMLVGTRLLPEDRDRLTIAGMFARLDMHPAIQANVPEWKDRR